MPSPCSRWEDLMLKMEREGNTFKALEFKEKLVECIVYTLQELVARGDIRSARKYLERGEEIANRYNIRELAFHLSLNRRRIEELEARRRPRSPPA